MTIQDLIGPSCSETETQIIISKTDLAAIVAVYMLSYHNDSTTPGYVPVTTNPIEATWTALQQAAIMYFTQTRLDSSPNQRILVTVPDVPQFFNNQWTFPVTSQLAFDGTAPTLTPANFN